MSNVTLWSRPTWDTERWMREFFGPAAASDWFKPLNGFRPATEIVKDGDDAVVRVELPGWTSRRTSTSSSTRVGW